MSLEIVFTPKAKETFLYTTLQIKKKWGDKSAKDFVKQVINFLSWYLFSLLFLNPSQSLMSEKE